jgi:hypothetical protein
MKRIRTDHVSLKRNRQALITSDVIEGSARLGVSKDHLLAGRAFSPSTKECPAHSDVDGHNIASPAGSGEFHDDHVIH